MDVKVAYGLTGTNIVLTDVHLLQITNFQLEFGHIITPKCGEEFSKNCNPIKLL